MTVFHDCIHYLLLCISSAALLQLITMIIIYTDYVMVEKGRRTEYQMQMTEPWHLDEDIRFNITCHREQKWILGSESARQWSKPKRAWTVCFRSKHHCSKTQPYGHCWCYHASTTAQRHNLMAIAGVIIHALDHFKKWWSKRQIVLKQLHLPIDFPNNY